jgi:hypothetical protein
MRKEITMNNPQKIDLDMSVDDLELSIRAANCLGPCGSPQYPSFQPAVRTLRELMQMTESDLLKRRNLGRKTLREIRELLAEMGLKLGAKPVPHDRCIAFECKNYRDEGEFKGDLCTPCHHFITHGGLGDVSNHSQVYRNAVDHFTSRLGVAVRVLLTKLLDVAK